MTDIAIMAAPAAPTYTDVVGAARILSVAPKTLRNWASLRSGPPIYRFGGALRYAVEDLHEWASDQKVAG